MSSSSPERWLKIWIVLGAFGFLFLTTLPYAIGASIENEYKRFQACSLRQRLDCQPSFVWVLNDWKLENSSTSTNTTTSNSATTPTPPNKSETQANAPVITVVKLEGAMFDSDWYRAKAGTTITVRAEVEGAKTVELYLIPKATATAPVAKLVAVMKKQADGSYTAPFKVTAGLLADLVVKATGENKAISSVSVNVATLE